MNWSYNYYLYSQIYIQILYILFLCAIDLHCVQSEDNMFSHYDRHLFNLSQSNIHRPAAAIHILIHSWKCSLFRFEPCLLKTTIKVYIWTYFFFFWTILFLLWEYSQFKQFTSWTYMGSSLFFCEIEHTNKQRETKKMIIIKEGEQNETKVGK